MNKNKKFFLLALLAAFSLVLAACGFGGDKGTDTKPTTDGDNKESSGKKELNVVVASEPPSLHPQLATDITSGAVLNEVFEGLTRLDKDTVPQKAMAEDWEVSEDGLTYTFTLRDAKWSNGDPVVAGDFAYSWEWALNPDNMSEYAALLYPIKGAEAYNNGKGSADDLGIEVKDDKTLVVTLENPTAYFLELTAFKTYAPLNQKVVEANEDWYANAGEQFVTNGPFKLADWKHNASITLEKNEDYWDADNVKLEKVNIGMVEGESTAVTMFKKGEIDFLGSPFQTVALDSIDAFRSEGKLNIADKAGVYWYKLNTKDKVMANENIRRALTLAMDRQGLIDNVLKGEQTPALGMVPTVIKGFEEDRGYFKDNDIEEAKKALEAGLKELGLAKASDLTIAISYNTSEAHASVAQYIQESWSKNLGINTTLDNSEWQVYLEKVNMGDYQVGRMGWIADYNDAYTFLEMYATAENGNNDTGWENPKYKELIEASNKEVDAEKRIQILKDAEAIAMKELPVAPIYYYTDPSVVSERVTGMEADILGNFQLKNVDVK